MTPRCGKCLTPMPEIACHNHKHTCRCGAIWLVIEVEGRLKWLWLGKGD